MSYPLFLPVLPWYPTDVYLDSDITGEKATASKEFILVLNELDSPVSVGTEFNSPGYSRASSYRTIKHLRPPTVFIYII